MKGPSDRQNVKVTKPLEQRKVKLRIAKLAEEIKIQNSWTGERSARLVKGQIQMLYCKRININASYFNLFLP